MKIALICLLICIIMVIAVSVSQQISDKLDFYCNLKLFLEQFKINVNFKQEKIKDFLLNTKPKKHFKVFINSYLNYLEKNQIKLEENTILDSNEVKELENIILNLGKFDVNNEISQLNSFLININEKIKICEEEKKKFCPLIIKLSLLFSIALAILLV